MNTAGRIPDTLAAVERDHGIEILFAVESGSRAWGHPSPDSDYDVRFIYRRPLPTYVTIGQRKDHLELGMIDGDLDLAGWDIDKALGLLVNGNPAILEWLVSPIIYRWSPWVQEINALASAVPQRRAAYWHYRALARRQRELLGTENPLVKLKRYFYVIRPALAVTWLAQHPDQQRVPMSVPHLMEQVKLPSPVREAIADLAVRKATTLELGFGPRIPVIDAFVAEALDGHDEPPAKDSSSVLWQGAANDLLHRITGAVVDVIYSPTPNYQTSFGSSP